VIKVNADALTDFTTLRISGNIYWTSNGAPTFSLKDTQVPAGQWSTLYNTITGLTDASRVLDPQFATTGGGTPLTLKATSPAINTGVPTALVAKDFLGTARPQGGTIDVGAYEY
jgi:hypothetical protein